MDINKSLLINAIQMCSINLAIYLIKHGTKYSPNLFSNHTEDPLFSAMRTGNLKLIKCIMNNMNSSSNDYLYSIFCIKYIRIALQNNYHHIVKYLINIEKKLNRLSFHDNILVDAIKCNNLNTVKFLINYGIDLNKANQKNELPLIVAIHHKRFEIIETLIRHGANPNYQCNCETPLTCAIVQRNINIINYLLEHGANIDQRISLSDTSSFNSNKSAAQIIKYNIEHCSNSNGKIKIDDTPLSIAVKLDDNDIIKNLIKHGPNLTIKVEHQYENAMNTLIKRNNYTMMEYLIEVGENLNQGDKNYNPLIISVGYNNYKLLNYLLSYGADVNEGSELRTPLTVAIENCNLNVIKILIKYGADVNKPDSYSTPLNWAIYYSNLDKVQYLIEEGAALNNNDYDLPLNYAAERKKKDIVNYLLTLGEDINKKNKDGNTPLISAIDCEKPDLDFIKFLIENGADPNIECKDHTPLSLAIKNNNFKIANYLINLGVDINKPNSKNNDTPLDVAIENNNLNIIKTLIENNANINNIKTINSPIIEKMIDNQMLT